MIFQETDLPGAYVIDLQPHADDRGFFARTFCEREFAARGLHTHFPQCNLSRNARAGTLRGMHYQAAPYGEVKLVRCVAGAIYDVIVDIRPGSPARGRWIAVELSAREGRALYIPCGLAHGFITLHDGTDVYYHMGAPFEPEAARGFRHDDPAFAIAWPRPPAVISPRDRSYPDFDWRLLDG